MIHKKFKEIKFDDFTSLVVNEVREGRTIEYKVELPDGTREKKIKLLLKEVSAFANTDGGDLIYGIEEGNGTAKALKGVAIEDPDNQKLKLENMIRDCIKPRLTEVMIESKEIPDSGNYLLYIRIPRSWNGPHMVCIEKHEKFYGRNSAGVYPMDVTDLRNAFLKGDTVSAKMRDFRNKRISSLVNEPQTVELEEGGIAVLHILPLTSYIDNRLLSMEQLFDNIDSFPFISRKRFSRIHKFNIDGINLHVSSNGKTENYIQIYRNGTVEFVMVFPKSGDSSKIFQLEWYENFVLEVLNGTMSFYNKVDVVPPVSVFLTLVDMEGFEPDVVSSHIIENGCPLDRHTTYCEETLIEDFEEKVTSSVVKPLLDSMWNAFGYQHSR